MPLEHPRLIVPGDLRLTDRFDCGEDVLNNWLRVHAWANHNSGSARVYVSLDPKAELIAGFYCLSAGSVEWAVAPVRISKGLAHHPISVVLIGRLAVDRGYLKIGLGRFLVQDAFRRVLTAAEAIGTRAVMVRAKSPEAVQFYKKLKFEASESDPQLFFHLLKDVRKSLEAAAEVKIPNSVT